MQLNCDASGCHHEDSCAAALYIAIFCAVFGKKAPRKASRRVRCADADVLDFFHGLADCFRSWPVTRSIALGALDFSRTRLLQRQTLKKSVTDLDGVCTDPTLKRCSDTDGVCTDRILPERFTHANVMHESEIGSDSEVIFWWIQSLVFDLFQLLSLCLKALY